MVLENPLIDARTLARAVDPVHGRGVPELAALRAAGVVSAGITTEILTGRPLRLYCSLNRDALAATRQGDRVAATQIRQHAERIEADTLSPWVDSLTSVATDPSIEADEEAAGDGWIDRLLFADAKEGRALVEPVLHAARDIAEVRDGYGMLAPPTRVITGRVWSIDDTFAEIRPEAGVLQPTFPAFAEDIFAAGFRLGDPVVVRFEALTSGQTLQVFERGLDYAGRRDPVSGHTRPPHLETLLDEREPPSRRPTVSRPLRRIA